MRQKTRKLFSYAFLLSCLVSSVLSEDPSGVTAVFKVLTPNSLKEEAKNANIKYTVANFGSVPFGRTVIGNVLVAKDWQNKNDACEAIDANNTGLGKTGQPESPILIAYRGGCTFVMKAINAQAAGAKLLIVVDNIEGENPEMILPIDDGNGASLHIATVMVKKNYGDVLIKEVEKGAETVTLSISFDLPKTDKVDYELWITSSDSSSIELVKDLYKYQDALKNKISFTPHYAVWYCPACQSNQFTAFDNQDCFGGGKFCHPDPDGQEGKLSGRDTLLEDLRQICIYQKYGAEYWWKYLYTFPSSQMNSENIETTSYDIIREIGVNKNSIRDCVNNSFVNENKTKPMTDRIYADHNTILSEERSTYLKKGILTWPSIIINGAIYRGNLKPAKLINQALCDAFTNEQPECENAYDDDDNSYVTPPTSRQSKQSSSFWLIFGVVIVAIIVFALIFIMYKRQVKREILKDMDYQISSTLHRYMAMKDEGEKNVQLSVEA